MKSSNGVRFFVPMKPIGKGRPRVTRGGMHTYTPAATVAAEKLIAQSALAAGAEPIEGPIGVNFCAIFEYPKSWSKKRRAEVVFHTIKPDLDNLVKLLDGLGETKAHKAIAFHSDAQICSISARKIYGYPQGLHIEIYSMTNERI